MVDLKECYLIHLANAIRYNFFHKPLSFFYTFKNQAKQTNIQVEMILLLVMG